MLSQKMDDMELHKLIAERLEKNAERMVQKYNRYRKPIYYNVEDKVWVSAQPDKPDGAKNYYYLAKIAKVNGNFTYRLEWITHGPFTTDEPESTMM
jgi:hypothetical protein